MPTFNLLDRPWIPVIWLNGEREELGLLELFARAGAIKALEHPSPLATAGLHRLLLAILYRALAPKYVREVAQWHESGWPKDDLTAYLEKWRSRFDLFDAQRPFWQVAEFQAKKKKSWSVLAVEYNPYNAKVLFDHFDVRSEAAARPAAVACWLAAIQTFALSCGKSEIAHTCYAPSATSILALPTGDDLRRTLLLSLPPQDKAVQERDLPVWERPPETLAYLGKNPERTFAGYADLYTWPSRAIHLIPENNGEVRWVFFASGVKLSDSGPIKQHDPMVAYGVNKKDGAEQPFQIKEDRGIWLDYASLMPFPPRNDKGEKGC
ncbi:MAG: type I-E CRISPR-associated protein Cse1/CasA, partial [Candidatus Adiutrix sp.]|nr:type I-E CRISPR-associated protein Cse1/CasA [Candidatus Adiutrix sp.]